MNRSERTFELTGAELGRVTTGQQLVCKILWDIQLGLRKFITATEIIMENEIWQEDIPEETISWLREWYPLVKDWVEELRTMDDIQLSHPRAAAHWAEILSAAGERPGLTDLLDSAPSRLPEEPDDDTIGYSIARHLLRLKPLKRDLRSQNYARLWRVQY